MFKSRSNEQPQRPAMSGGDEGQEPGFESRSTISELLNEDDIAEAVEQSYATRLAGSTDLSPAERRRIREKQGKPDAKVETFAGRNDKPTQEQLAEIEKLSSEARVPDESEFVASKEEAEMRIRDLKEKARME
jgi:hypothetical protein